MTDDEIKESSDNYAIEKRYLMKDDENKRIFNKFITYNKNEKATTFDGIFNETEKRNIKDS